MIDSEDSDEDCPCTSTVVDQCIMGNWKVNPNSMRSLVERMLQGAKATLSEFEVLRQHLLIEMDV